MTGPDPAHPETPSNAIRLAPRVEIDPGAIDWTFARSSGPGGQNVNKRSTKAILRIHVGAIPLTDAARRRLLKLAPPTGATVTEDGDLLIHADETRSQAQNREAALDRLRQLVGAALVPPKPRIKTKPTKASNRRRLDEKAKRSQTKSRRRDTGHD